VNKTLSRLKNRHTAKFLDRINVMDIDDKLRLKITEDYKRQIRWFAKDVQEQVINTHKGNTSEKKSSFTTD
jgi:tRNA A37 N6-isopentenylltransferase MiaA